MEFRKALAIYYYRWFRDSKDSQEYCLERGDTKRAMEYSKDAEKYFDIIIHNEDAIEFFSLNGNAFKVDSALPKEFKGYK